jgi:protein involved in sex pheromone biosynthesis
MYTQTYNELQRAALLLDDIKPCKLHGCKFCLALNSVFNYPQSEAYIQSQSYAFHNDMRLVDSAQETSSDPCLSLHFL